MAEKTGPAAVKQRFFQLEFRLTALLPLVASTVAFILTLIAVLSGSAPNVLEDSHILSLNTTDLGTNIIELSHVSSTPTNNKRFDPLDPLGILPTSLPPLVPTAVLPSPSEIASALADPIGAINSAFDQIAGNITEGIDTTLNNAIAAGVQRTLGISQFYTMHILNICQGNLETGSSNDEDFNITSCKSYRDGAHGVFNKIANVPSSFTVATTNVSVPILSEVASIGSFLEWATPLIGRFNLAVYILSLIGSGGSAILALYEFFFRSPTVIRYLSMIASFLASSFHLSSALSATIFSMALTSIMNTFGNDVGLSMKVGSRFLALIWVSWVLSVITSVYFLVIWFIEYRTISYKARPRESTEMGNYRGIFKEIWADFKIPKKEEVVPLVERVPRERAPTPGDPPEDPARRNIRQWLFNVRPGTPSIEPQSLR